MQARFPQTCANIPITHACLNLFATKKILIYFPTKNAHSRNSSQAPLIVFCTLKVIALIQ
jgi:hypothetical protein